MEIFEFFALFKIGQMLEEKREEQQSQKINRPWTITRNSTIPCALTSYLDKFQILYIFIFFKYIFLILDACAFNLHSLQ
jgi:hypothetical protein